MSIKDATTLNRRYDSASDGALVKATGDLLTQLAKVKAEEVQGMVVSILNKDGTNNLIGLAGAMADLKECTLQIVLRLEQCTTARPRDPSHVLNPEDIDGRGGARVDREPKDWDKD